MYERDLLGETQYNLKLRIVVFHNLGMNTEYSCVMNVVLHILN